MAEHCQPAKGANRYGQRPGRCWCRVSGLRTGGLLLESRAGPAVPCLRRVRGPWVADGGAA